MVVFFIAPRIRAAPARGAPVWAYPVEGPDDVAAPDDGKLRHVPDSVAAYLASQISNISGFVPDWHPDEHPPMPEIVRSGRAPSVYACAYCHLPNGAGRPENTSLAGLSAPYIREQMLAFRSGARPGSEPRRGPQNAMVALARSATVREIEDAAAYFFVA